MWCGARANPGTPYICHFMDAPGYGNGWDQALAMSPYAFVGTANLSYKLRWDCEPDYDFVRVEYDAGGGDWQALASYTGDGVIVEQLTRPMTQIATKFRFRFVSVRLCICFYGHLLLHEANMTKIIGEDMTEFRN